MEASKALQKDWSSLPPEVPNLIAKDLREIHDLIGPFPCRLHSMATLHTPITDLNPQFPWILETWREVNDSNLRFYTVHDPKYVDKFPHEISEGYLISELYDKSQHTAQLNLSNPLNNDEIPLPECRCDPYLFRQRYSQIEEYGLAYCAHSCQDYAELLCCQLGQKYWCQQPCELEWGDDEGTYDWVILKGMLFSLERDTRVTKVTDIGTSSLVYVVPPVEDHVTVKSSTFLEAGGYILGVFILYNEPANFLWEIRRMDINESSFPCWAKVENIGNHALFMDVYGVFMLKANELAGIKANCMYYLYEKDENPYDLNMYEDFVEDSETTFEVERIDIQTGAKEFCQCLPPLGNRVCWFVPNLRHLREN